MAAPIETPVRAWGRIGAPPHEVVRPHDIAAARRAIAAAGAGAPWLPRGLGRSYGDVAFNAHGRLIDATALDRFIAFDRDTGLLEAEAGVTLEDVIRVTLPQGWFLPTTPGTRFVTLGGAVANDVHGKNHHRAGSFGCSVRGLELARSDGDAVTCSPAANSALFGATVGGLGLTGLITRVTLQLARVPSAWLQSEDIAFADLKGFFALAEESEAQGWEHTVAWMDCSGAKAGRGIFSRANWSEQGDREARLDRFRPRLIADAPSGLLNRHTVAAFNTAYFHLHANRRRRRPAHFSRVFYPLDGIADWNRLYGRPGFYQYQCVIPRAGERQGLASLLDEIARAGEASFLAVVKTFGARASPGLLSFPMAGTTLALDFPNRGGRTLALFERLDRIVADTGGRLYPAKDARMPAELFRRGYPRWRELAAARDPAIQSDFWRRVAAT